MTNKTEKMKILISDPLGKAGKDILEQDGHFIIEEKTGLPPEELKKIIGDYEAVLVRSGTKLTKDILEHAHKLKVIGRAGVGVDNVDLEAATKKGIIVMNTPEGNTISTAEHTFSLLMAMSRKIPQAVASVRSGQWKRQAFLGFELNGKTLGIIGFGRIGREVAKRALAFNMQVVVYDPFIAAGSSHELAVQFAELQDLLKKSDYITVHTPLTPQTKYLINADALKLCKQGVQIINCARGGIVEEKALLEALQSGKVAAAALDVFEKEPPQPDNPLLALPQVITTPHLGAATQEAQENVAVDVAKQVIDALNEKAIKNAVNLPSVDTETYKVLRPWINLAEKIGSLYSQLFGGSFNSVTIRYGGEVSRFSLSPLTVAILKGLLTPICGETVNFVNAPSMAKERGIAVNESKSTQEEDFSNYIELEVSTCGKNKKSETNKIMGTLFGDQLLRIVRINEFILDVEPTSHVIFIHNEDQPGVVGTVGTILGKNSINIAEMSLGRVMKGTKRLAMTVINTDNEVPQSVLDEIKKFGPIIDTKVVQL